MTIAPPPPAWSERPAAEGVPGGFWIRFVAYVIDALVMMFAGLLLVGVFVGAVILSGQSIDEEGRSGLLIILFVILLVAGFIVINWLYEALMTSSPRGATLGKMALDPSIVPYDGAPLSFGRATAATRPTAPLRRRARARASPMSRRSASTSSARVS